MFLLLLHLINGRASVALLVPLRGLGPVPLPRPLPALCDRRGRPPLRGQGEAAALRAGLRRGGRRRPLRRQEEGAEGVARRPRPPRQGQGRRRRRREGQEQEAAAPSARRGGEDRRWVQRGRGLEDDDASSQLGDVRHWTKGRILRRRRRRRVEDLELDDAGAQHRDGDRRVAPWRREQQEEEASLQQWQGDGDWRETPRR